MKINKFINFIIASALLLGSSFNALADNKPFYTSKSNKIGITGDYKTLALIGFGTKIINNPIEIDYKLPNKPLYQQELDVTSIEQGLNEEQVGKKLLNYFFLDENSNFDENLTLLSDRVGKNLSKKDIQSKAANLTITEGVSNKEIMEILSNNYIFLSHKTACPITTEKNGKKHTDTILVTDYWVAFHVEITEKNLNDVYNAWDMSPTAIGNTTYDNIKINVKYVAQGKSYDFNEVSSKIPALAVRGAIESRNPCIASVGKKDGFNDKDKVDIYRQYLDKKGNLISKKISSARICDINDENARMYFISGSRGSAQNGDQVVKKDDYGWGVSVAANWMKGTDGIGVGLDWLRGNSKSGWESVILLEGSINRTTNRENHIINNIEFKPASIFNVGIGFGARYNLIGRLSIMPYILAKGDFATITEIEPENAPEDYEAYSETYAYLTFPIGLRFNLNICYPVQLTAGIEYVVLYDAFKKKAEDIYYGKDEEYVPEISEYDYINDNLYKNIGVKRDGLSLYAGIRIAF